MGNLFEYAPLTSPDSTRLLDILPASHHNDPIHIQLREVSLHPPSRQDTMAERVRYDALSYVWGAKVGTQPILCNGNQLLVTPNCELALRYLRNTSHSRSLWVDVICIDQSSRADKSQQVGKMGEIYHWADLVIVWLGEEDELTPVAFRYLRRLALRRASENKTYGAFIRITYRLWSKSISRKDDRLKLGSPHSGYLRDMLCGPYFQRFWTLQELAMGRSAMIVSGKRPLTWATFAEGADIFLNGNGDHYSGFFGPNGTDEIHGFFSHYLTWMMLYAPINGLTVPPVDREQMLLRVQLLINASHGNRTSDPKDRLFALYNIFKMINIQLPRPDYEKSEADIHYEATLMIIQQTASLCIFEFFPPKEPSQSPSWVHNFESPDGREGYGEWAACGNSRVNLPLVPSGVSLSLNGIRVGTTSQIAPAVVRQSEMMLDRDLSEMTRTAAVASSFRSWCDHARAHGIESHPQTSEDPKVALFGTLVSRADLWGSSVNQLWDAFHILYEAARSLSAGSTTVVSSDSGDNPGTRLWSAALSLPNSPHSHVLNRFLDVFWQFYESKRLFTTDHGYFGVGPRIVDSDDVIVLLAGATMPMVLRPQGNSFRLIGPAYIHGIMRGEAWPEMLTTPLSPFDLS